MDKVLASAATALDKALLDGMTVAAGGSGFCGIRENLIDTLRKAGTRELATMDRTMANANVCALLASLCAPQK